MGSKLADLGPVPLLEPRIDKARQGCSVDVAGNRDILSEDFASSIGGNMATDLQAEVDFLGPWYHKIDLGDGVFTKSEGHNPAAKWRVIAPHVPEDMTGMRTLEIGCSSAFYSVKMAERGAECYACDLLPIAIKQAKFLARFHGVNIDVVQRNVYDLHAYRGMKFDYVLFLGLLYHIRYPMLILDMLHDLDFDSLLLQTATYSELPPKEYTGWIQSPVDTILNEDDFPSLRFVENSIRYDKTTWWVFNPSAVAAMMRSAGFTDIRHLATEFWFAKKGDQPANSEIEYRSCLQGVVNSASENPVGQAVSDEWLSERIQRLENQLLRLQDENAKLKKEQDARPNGRER